MLNNQKNHKKTPQSYNVYFPLDVYVYKFPDGYQLGHAKLLAFRSLPTRVRELFEFNWKFQFEKNEKHISTLREYLEKKRGIVFLQISVKAHDIEEANQEAFKLADESVNVLRIIYGYYFPLNEKLIMDEKQQVGQLSKLGIKPTSTRIGELDDSVIGKLTDILIEQDPSDIETRLRNAVLLLGTGTKTASPEVRYTLLTTALEALLITEDVQQSRGRKLAEKVKFLIETEPEKQTKLFKKVKDGYHLKRSGFLHQTLRYKHNHITNGDVKELWGVVSRVFKKLLELRDEGYKQIRKKEGVKTVDKLVEDSKFS